MSTTILKCPKCSQEMTINESDLGETFACPNCNESIKTAAPSKTVTSPQKAPHTPLILPPRSYGFSGWAVFIIILACLNLVGGTFLLIIGLVSGMWLLVFPSLSMLFSSIFIFLFAWFIQQVYLSNAINKYQAELLEKIAVKIYQ